MNDTISSTPAITNSEPYGDGWLLKIRVEDWDSIKPQLTEGAQISGPYEAKMQADGFDGCDS